MTLTTKQKGSIGELAIAADLSKRGYQVAWPFGEYGDWDLLVNRGQGFERVQVKFSSADDAAGVIHVRARCHSVLAGRVGKTNVYGPDSFEWIGIFEPNTDQCYYIPSGELTGAGELYLRITPPKKANKTIRWAYDYQSI